MRKQRQVDNVTTSRAFLRVVSVAFGVAMAVTASLGPTRADTEEDQRIDRQLGALEDPRLIQILASPPVPPGGHTGPQPFDQEPPAAQADFSVPRPVVCVVTPNNQVICQ